MIRKSIILVCLLALVPVGNSYGQNFDSIYGSGLHKYFSGCNAEAIQLLDAAIAAKPNDPRPYYFRGLAKMNYGDKYSAQADFQLGAQMEALGKRRSSLVSRSLERIQGANRLCIEQARQTALNPSLQTARNYYGASPANVVYGQPLTYPTVAPTALPPASDPSQAIIQAPPGTAAPMTGEIQVPPTAGLATGATDVAAPANLLTTPESTSTSLPATPLESADAAPAARTTPAVESRMEPPISLDLEESTSETPTINPAAEPRDLGETPQANEPESAPATDPFGTEPASGTIVPEAEGAPVIDDSAPIEFPSEPTDESPFGDAPFEEAEMPAEDVPTEETPTEDVPAEDASSEPQNSNDESTEGDSTDEESTEEEGDINDDPFGG
jgi:hypothetical protein